MARAGDRHPPVRGQEARNTLVTENRRLSFFAARRWAEQLRLDDEDARAECDVALIKAAELWRPDGGRTFAGYAVKAMFNQLLNFSKKERRRVATRAQVVDWDARTDTKQYDPAEMVCDKEENQFELVRLRAAIARLDARPRQVMMARASGEKPSIIAERLGVSRQRIEQIEKRARGRLMELLRVG